MPHRIAPRVLVCVRACVCVCACAQKQKQDKPESHDQEASPDSPAHLVRSISDPLLCTEQVSLWPIEHVFYSL